MEFSDVLVLPGEFDVTTESGWKVMEEAKPLWSGHHGRFFEKCQNGHFP
jgi:hypothetical protein